MLQSNNNRIQILPLLLILSLGLIFTWKIFVLGMGNMYEEQILNDKDAAKGSLAWSDYFPSVLFQTSQDTRLDISSTEKEKLLLASLSGNPADGRVLIALANLWRDSGDLIKADDAASLATKSLPSDAFTQIEVASYWLKRNKLDKAIANWNTVLQTTPQLKLKLFPLFLSWVEEDKLGETLARILLEPPQWWTEFFVYAAKNTSRIHLVTKLYELRKQSPAPMIDEETNSYVTRLKSDGFWPEAFLVWLNALGTEGMKYLGQPYNGSFEAALTQSGFGWNNRVIAGVTVEVDHTYGNKAGQALHVLFEGGKTRYRHLYQTLYLAPATYKIRGRVRPDSVITTGGLKWIMRCISADRRVIGESERFLGVSQWRSFSFEFEVTNDQCVAQELRLESVINKPEDAIISGGLWFDSILIER